MPLTYRLATEADVPSLNRLWLEDAGWGGLTVQQWREWYEQTPYGPCYVSIAEQGDGEVVGQLVLTPSRVRVDGVERKALRVSAPIVRGTARRPLRDGAHPAVQLYLTIIHAAIADGVEVVYTLPDAAWVGFFRWTRHAFPDVAGFETATFACRELAVATTPPFGSGGVEATPVTAFDADFDDLWSRSWGAGEQTAVVRRAAWLQYKFGDPVLRVALRDRAGTLAGYAAVRPRDGLLLDAVAVEARLYGPLLQAAVARLRAEGPLSPGALRVMETPALQPALDRLGATGVDFTFAMAAAALPGGPSAASVTPARWLTCAGD